MVFQPMLTLFWLCLASKVSFVFGRLEFRLGVPLDIQCSDQQVEDIKFEAAQAAAMAAGWTAGSMDFGGYVYYLFPPESYTNANFQRSVAAKYARLASLPTTTSYTLTVTCDFQDEGCVEGAHEVAEVDAHGNVMNVCPLFWGLESSHDFESWWTNAHSVGKDLITLTRIVNLRSTSLLHEFTHTTYGFNAQEWYLTSDDIAYGISECMDLAAGAHSRRGMDEDGGDVLCPELVWMDAQKTIPRLDANGDQEVQEGDCPATKAELNADSIAFWAAGIYYSAWCRSIIPINAAAREQNAQVRQAQQAQQQAQNSLYQGSVRGMWSPRDHRMSPQSPPSMDGQWVQTEDDEWVWYERQYQYPPPPERRSTMIDRRAPKASKKPGPIKKRHHSDSASCKFSKTKWYRTTAMNVYFQAGTSSDGNMYRCDHAYAFYKKL